MEPPLVSRKSPRSRGVVEKPKERIEKLLRVPEKDLYAGDEPIDEGFGKPETDSRLWDA